MALWDKPESSTTSTTAHNPPAQAGTTTAQAQPHTPPPKTGTGRERGEGTESLIASGLTIEGKINGKGHVRVAGRFKGDIHVEGDLHIDADAKVEGQVNAGTVTVTGDLQGNIEKAKHVELKQGGVITGDLKTATLSVAAGARMRGNVDVGFGESSKT